MEELLKNLVKEAVMEALNEYANAGVAVASEGGDENSGKPAEPEKPKKPTKPKPIEPDPMFGPSGFSMR
jgi:hypothetical protein